jgi:hypothetical protein
MMNGANVLETVKTDEEVRSAGAGKQGEVFL